MRIPIKSQKAFITEYLARHVQKQELSDQQDSAFPMDSIVRDSFTELIRLQMREIATDSSDRWYWGKSILDQAIQQVLSDVKRCLPDFMNVDFSSHEKFARVNLKLVTKEIANLHRELERARRQESVFKRDPFTNDADVKFEIISLGPRQSLEGFVLIPTWEQECLLNLENLEKSWTLTGDWFPFQLAIGDLTFVIDDDGTVFTSTDGLPAPLILKSREVLCQIAQRLYMPNPTLNQELM